MKKALFILAVLPAAVFADCDLASLIPQIRAGAQWNLRGDTYPGLEWLDATQTKPTRQELLDQFTVCQSAATARRAAKVQARIDVRDTSLTQAQRLQALLILLDLDQ